MNRDPMLRQQSCRGTGPTVTMPVSTVQNLMLLALDMGTVIRSIDDAGEHGEVWTNDGDAGNPQDIGYVPDPRFRRAEEALKALKVWPLAVAPEQWLGVESLDAKAAAAAPNDVRMNAVHVFATRYDEASGKRQLDETSIDDIPQDEQSAYWAAIGDTDGQASDEDVGQLYATWYYAQQRMRAQPQEVTA